MRQKKYMLVLGVIVLFLLLSWGITYYQHSSIEKVITRKEEAAQILEVVPISDQKKMVIFEYETMIEANVLTKGFFGWQTIGGGAPAVKNRYTEDTLFRPSNFSILSVDGHSYLYGYVNPVKINQIRFQNDSFDVRHDVSTYHWYIPLQNEEDLNFNPNQFSIIQKDGTEVFYPFD